MSNLKLGVVVVSVHGLMPKDEQGFASAYVELRFDNQRFRTTTKDKDLNPVWNESFYFNLPDPSNKPNLTFDAFVYNLNQLNYYTSYFAKVCLTGESFVRYPDALVLRCPMLKAGFLSSVKPKLVLKVFTTDDPSLSSSNPLPAMNSSMFVDSHSSQSQIPDPVDQMKFLFVRVVKARDLPTMDATGSLDPYVEVRVGNYKGTTRHFQRNKTPEWNEVFAFASNRVQTSVLEVVVKNKDLVMDDFVGLVRFDKQEIPTRVPPESPLAPEWYPLEDKKGEKTKGELMLAVWYGTQADEAFPDAWHSDTITPDAAISPYIRSKVYHSPRLWYVQVIVIEAQYLIVDKNRFPHAYVKVQIGNQVQKTKIVHAQTMNPEWGEELKFVAAEPFEDDLMFSVKDHVGANKDETIGMAILPLNAVERLADDRDIRSLWVHLENPTAAAMDEKEGKKDKFSTRLHIRVALDESTHYSSDLRQTMAAATTITNNHYDVFLSFRGEETRPNIVSHLYKALLSAGVKVFKDTPDLPKGKSISPQLLQAIHASKSHIVVFSPNYASSTWCMDELFNIVWCCSDEVVLYPVFYGGVDPSHVRKQKGSFGEAMKRHESDVGKDRVALWRWALTNAGSLAGWHVQQTTDEAHLIEEIVTTIRNDLHPQ